MRKDENAVPSANEMIAKYPFDPHCENGLYLECHYPASGEKRPASGSIYYAVRPGERTEFHRIDCDEYWCFHAGSTLELWVIGLDGQLAIRHLGLGEDAQPSVRFAAGEIFASRLPADASDSTFLTCITVPRFSYDGFEMFDRDRITALYPEVQAFFDGETIVRRYHSGDEETVAEMHQRIYAEEYHWGPAFSDYAMKIARDFAAADHGENEAMWVAEQNGRIIGSVMLCAAGEPEVGQLRLFLVEKDARCCGVGSRLLSVLMNHAQRCGYKKLILWSASPLTAALRQYEKLGFRETERETNNVWSLDGETVYEIKMEKDLPSLITE